MGLASFNAMRKRLKEQEELKLQEQIENKVDIQEDIKEEQIENKKTTKKVADE